MERWQRQHRTKRTREKLTSEGALWPRIPSTIPSCGSGVGHCRAASPTAGTALQLPPHTAAEHMSAVPRGAAPWVTLTSQGCLHEARAAVISTSQGRAKHLPGRMLAHRARSVLISAFARVPSNWEGCTKAGCTAGKRQIQKRCTWVDRLM